MCQNVLNNVISVLIVEKKERFVDLVIEGLVEGTRLQLHFLELGWEQLANEVSSLISG